MEPQLKQSLVHEKPVEILVETWKLNNGKTVELGNNETPEKAYAGWLAPKVDTTYSHTVKIVGKLKKQGLVKLERKGRRKYLNLTDKGEKVAVKLNDLIEEIETTQD